MRQKNLPMIELEMNEFHKKNFNFKIQHSKIRICFGDGRQFKNVHADISNH